MPIARKGKMKVRVKSKFDKLLSIAFPFLLVEVPLSEKESEIVPIIVGLIVMLVIFAALVFCCVKKTRGGNKIIMRQPESENQQSVARKYQSHLPFGSESKQNHQTIVAGMSNSNNNSPLPDNDGLSGAGLSAHGIGGSSNGLAYDRSHVTGARLDCFQTDPYFYPFFTLLRFHFN